MKKSHLVFVPCPGIGHLMSAVEFTKLLINRHEHLSITVLLIRSSFDPKVNAFILSLSSSLSFPQRLRFVLLPQHPETTNSDSLHPSVLFDSLIEHQKPNVRDVVFKLNSDPDSPRLAGFVVDVFCTTMVDVATEFGVPTMVFFTSGAAFLGFKLHIHTLRDRDNVDPTVLNFKDSGTEFAIPSFDNLVPASVFPGNVLDKDWARLLFNQASSMKNKVQGILVNTFEELESHAIQSFSHSDLAVYPVGPILSLGTDKIVQEGSESDVMDWLDDQPQYSVIFLCFGSWGSFDEEGNQVTEIASALEASGVHFVWSLRKAPPKGSIGAAGNYSNLEEVLPEGFLQRTAEMGRVMISWAPQAQILAHKAVGGFVSHCGWNSILKSIYYGVPIATWPIYAEQQMNAFQLVRELKMSVEISLDYRRAFGSVDESGVISAERITEGIKQVMEKESEVRKKVKEMSEMSKRVLREGGSSYSYLGRFIHDILNWG